MVGLPSGDGCEDGAAWGGGYFSLPTFMARMAFKMAITATPTSANTASHMLAGHALPKPARRGKPHTLPY